MLAQNNYDITAFNRDLKNSGSGFNFGPYGGYIISKNWSTDVSMTDGRLQNINIVNLLSSFLTQSMNVSLHTTGVYPLSKFQLRPQPLISFTHY